MKTIPIHEQTSKGTRIAVATGLGAVAVFAGMHISQGSPAKEPKQVVVRNMDEAFSRLPASQMETGIMVGSNQSPTDIALTVNGLNTSNHPRLSGVALQEEANYIQNQGSITESMVRLKNCTMDMTQVVSLMLYRRLS